MNLRLLLRRLLCRTSLLWGNHLRPASACAVLLNKVLDIGLADASAEASAGNLAEIDVVFTRNAPHQR